MNKQEIEQSLKEKENIYSIASDLLRGKLYSSIDMTQANDILGTIYDLLTIEGVRQYNQGVQDTKRIYNND